MDGWRLAEHLHGHFGWLAAAALAHPAVVLRRRGRRAPWAVRISVGLVTLVAIAGGTIYGPYRERLKQGIFQSAPQIGLLFERKEHLAFGALVFAWVGAVAYAASSKRDLPFAEGLHRLAHRSFVVAALLAAVVALLGTYVASYRTF